MYLREEPMMSQYDPELISRLKEEIINDLKARREWQEEYAYRSPRHYRPDYGWWLDREEYDYERNRLLLRRELQNELRAMGQMNQRLGQVQDPEVRRLLYELLQESHEQGMGVSELMQSVNQNRNVGLGSGLLDRIFGPYKGIDRRSFGWGAGAAVLGFLFMPALGKSMRPLARKAVEEAMSLSDRLQSTFAQAKEEFEDIVAEASFNKLKDSMSGPAGPEKPQ